MLEVTKTKEQTRWEKLHDFMNENKDLLFIVANPKTDELAVSFNLLNTFLRFPPGPVDQGVIFNVLRKSKFKDAVNPLLTGVMEGLGANEEGASPLLFEVASSVKAIGEKIEEKRSKLEIIKDKHGKRKKGSKN